MNPIRKSLILCVSSIIIILFTGLLFKPRIPLNITSPLWGDDVSSDKRLALKGVEIKELRNQISLLNLLNGLYLSDKQVKSLLDMLYEVRDLKEDRINKALTHFEDYKNALGKFRDDLMDGSAEPEMLQSMREYQEGIEGMQHDYDDELIGYEKKVRSILTENQVVLIENFKPCLLPRKDMADPTRIGQANDYGPAEKVLEKVRGIPETKLERFKDKQYEKYFDKIETKWGVLTDEEKQAEIERVDALVNKIRSMSDAEFQIRKKELASELLEPYQDKEYRPKKGELSKVGKFMLDTDLIGILEKRVAMK